MNTAKFLPTGTRLVLLLSLPDLATPMRIISRVAWIRPHAVDQSYDCGLQFTVIASQDQDLLAGTVERGMVRQITYS